MNGIMATPVDANAFETGVDMTLAATSSLSSPPVGSS